VAKHFNPAELGKVRSLDSLFKEVKYRFNKLGL